MDDEASGLGVAGKPANETVVHLFDGPYVTIGGRRLDVPEGSKRLVAFAALRPRHLERRYASGVLWPMGDDHRAAGNLRSALWRLRGAGIDIMASDKWSLTLKHDVEVDAQLTNAWADRVINGAICPADLAVVPQHIDALDLLPGLYDDWAIMERERLRQRMLHALESLSRRLSSMGRFADAIEAALTAVSAEPLRESAQRVLIEAHAAEGNWGEALRCYACYRKLVRDELGVEPSAALASFVHRHVPGTSRVPLRMGRPNGPGALANSAGGMPVNRAIVPSAV